MPDISALNGTAIDSVAEFDGLTVTAPAVSAPAAAYSVRLLGSALGVPTYTGAAMRVRRVTGTGNTGNDDEADVAFDTSLTEPTISLDSAVSNFSAGGSNATTLGQFLNVGTVGGTTYTDADSLAPNTAAAYVDEWKDQSGNANHATQGTPSNQPQIHNGVSGSDLITFNGKPSVRFINASTTYLDAGASAAESTMTYFEVHKANGFRAVWSPERNENAVLADSINFVSGAPYDGITAVISGVLKAPGTANDTQAERLVYWLRDGANSELGLNGTTAITGTQRSSVTNRIRIGTRSGLTDPFDGHFSEFIAYASDQSANRTNIESNINTYFSIY